MKEHLRELRRALIVVCKDLVHISFVGIRNIVWFFDDLKDVTLLHSKKLYRFANSYTVRLTKADEEVKNSVVRIYK